MNDFLLQEKYDGVKTKEYEDDLKRVANGEPLDYVIGFTYFLGNKIDLSLRPLIPRAETEFIMEDILKELKPNSKILDMFAGSGCIGLACAKAGHQVTFADIDENISKQIQINLDINKLNGEIIHSNIFSDIKEKFDYIIANPPYVPTERKIQKSVKDYEPHIALFSGDDGLDVIKRFLDNADDFYTDTLYMEFDVSQAQYLKDSLKDREYSLLKDQYNKSRFLKLKH